MNKAPTEAVVIGAGAAGLAAANELAAAGVSVHVIEARERLGGRIWTHREPGVPVPLELGAEFIHGRSAPVFTQLERAGLAAIDAPRDHWTLDRGRLRRRDSFFPDIAHAMRSSKILRRRDMPFADFMERAGRELSKEARRFACMLVEGFDAADPAVVSARSIVEEWSGTAAASAPTFRPLEGYGALIDGLAASLAQRGVRIQLRTAARRIEWKPGRVRVDARFLERDVRLDARHAVIAVPLGVLQQPPASAGALRFEPALDSKQAALEGLSSGPVMKVILQFHRAFWEDVDDGRYCDAPFFHAPDAAFPTFWTSLPIRAPVMVAWAGGPRAQRLSSLASRDVIAAALESLQTLFGDRVDCAALLTTAHVHNWQHDPFARGAYSSVVAGGGKSRATLAGPVRGTLFFAGEAADVSGDSGTVGGALESGRRAAREILRC